MMIDYKNNHYLSGFVDGEGCFRIRHPQNTTYFNVELQVSQRADSALVLDQLCNLSGGYLHTDERRARGLGANTDGVV